MNARPMLYAATGARALAGAAHAHAWKPENRNDGRAPVGPEFVEPGSAG